MAKKQANSKRRGPQKQQADDAQSRKVNAPASTSAPASAPAPANDAAKTGGFFLVATPIGNSADITLRALDAFRNADIIFCEDTRVTQKLLMMHAITGKKLISAREHNERISAEAMLNSIRQGQHVLYASDAGLPCISDPGNRIVQHLLQHGVPVSSLPGPNAALTALQISGLPSEHFYFAGFLPPKTRARRGVLETLKPLNTTLLFYESPHRVLDTLADMKAVLGNRPACMARELTKMYEEVRRGTLDDLARILNDKPAIKGEFVLVVGAFADGEEEMRDEAEIDKLLVEVRKTLSAKETVAIMSTRTGLPKRELYQRLLHINDKKKD